MRYPRQHGNIPVGSRGRSVVATEDKDACPPTTLPCRPVPCETEPRADGDAGEVEASDKHSAPTSENDQLLGSASPWASLDAWGADEVRV